MVRSTLRRSSRPRSLPRGIARVVRGGLTRRLRFPEDRVGEILDEEGERYELFLETRYDPRGTMREPEAELVVRFRLRTDGRGSRPLQRSDRASAYALTPVLLRLAGFRSKLWAFDSARSRFLSLYTFETGADAHASIPFLRRVLARIAQPDSVSFHVRGTRRSS